MHRLLDLVLSGLLSVSLSPLLAVAQQKTSGVPGFA
jgi:hypothetical protein